MKAACKVDRNKGIKIKDVPIPEVEENDVLVKVKKAAVCGTDIHLYNWNQWCENVNAKNPMVIGHEFCGEIVETGRNVKELEKGDLIAAETHIPCGTCFLCKTGKQHICLNMKIIGVHTDGAFAEYAKIPAVCAWKLDKDINPDIGAIYEPFGIGVHALSKENFAGKTVLVTGCGPIGLFTINLIEIAGADKIFAVDLNEYRLDLATKMGKNIIPINPGKVNGLNKVMEATSNIGVDIVVELTGSSPATRLGFEVLKKNGTVILVGLHDDDVPLDLVNNVIYKEATIFGVTGREMFDSWYGADKLILSEKSKAKEVITHRFSLEETEQAILTASEGNCGKVIIDID
ncbi:MAG: L-threonine 3-dehydrogenase [Bacillota bacterium]